MTTTVAKIFALLKEGSIDIDALDGALNDASSEERIAVIRKCTPAIQKNLFEAAKGRKVTTEGIVSSSHPALTETIHEGQNTLPAFRQFQKRFCNPSEAYTPDNRRVLWGYNHQSFAGITGPGYFVAYDDDDLGEVVIDYRELPPERPDSWPPILDNKARLGRFVYHGMVDRLRRVSDHVTIGRAYKKKPMNAWFLLVRQDEPG